ncbi:MAG TPA: hypothetical protein VJS63_11785 [Bradyrhizobium sp.]|nr:hypothetical protein [Bradyrhizobium sp.]
MAEICAYQGDNAIHISSIPEDTQPMELSILARFRDEGGSSSRPQTIGLWLQLTAGGNAIARQANWE